MLREELEHAIRASASVLGQDTVIVVGSQSILGSWDEDDLPEAVTLSTEVDICPIVDDEDESLATLLDGAIGEFSDFHQQFDFYVQGVGQTTSVLPWGWRARVVTVTNSNTNGAVGLCLDPHDLCAAKLVAGRAKDHRFVSALLDAGKVDMATLDSRLELVDEQEPGRATARSWVRSRRRISADSGREGTTRPAPAIGQGRVRKDSTEAGQFTSRVRPESDVHH